jgi:prevent-host-death family protein
MAKVVATEFCRNFGRYQLEAQREPIAVTRNGTPTGYFISPAEYELFQRLRRRMATSIRPEDLPDHVVDAIREAKVNPAKALPDTLLDE